MAEELQGIKPEITKPEFQIKNNNGTFEVSSPMVDLASAREPLRFAVTLEKAPSPVTDGTAIENITIDRESPKLQRMLAQASELKDIPDRDKPRRLLQLLRSQVNFAYNDVVEELGKTNPELAEWVARNTGINSSSSVPLRLSEIVESGHGVCRHLSVAMLVLAKEAGMNGAYLTTAPGFSDLGDEYIAKNVVRKDNDEQLFKMSKVGDPIGGHAWVELRTADGEWIPVDPSTQLVGDTPEGMATFQEANYRAMPGMSLEIEGFPKDVGHLGNQDLWFLPGEQTHTGVLKVNSREKRKPIVISFDTPKTEPADDEEQWPKPTQHKGALSFQLSSHATTGGLTVAVKDVKPQL